MSSGTRREPLRKHQRVRRSTAAGGKSHPLGAPATEAEAAGTQATGHHGATMGTRWGPGQMRPSSSRPQPSTRLLAGHLAQKTRGATSHNVHLKAPGNQPRSQDRGPGDKEACVATSGRLDSKGTAVGPRGWEAREEPRRAPGTTTGGRAATTSFRTAQPAATAAP